MNIYYLYLCPQAQDLDPSWLSEPERQRLARMRFPPRRQDWLAGRLAARRLLSGLGYPFDGLEIANELSGAPYARRTDSGERLPGRLSISHREGRAFCAYTPEPGVHLGADLEKLEPRSEGFGGEYFTQVEQAPAKDWPEPQRSAWFNLLWSLKECCLKVVCTGLRIDPLDLQVEVKGFDWPLPANWQLARGQNLRSGERFALAWEGRGDYLLTLGWDGAVEAPTLEEIQA